MSRVDVYPLPELIRDAPWDVQDSGRTTPRAGYDVKQNRYRVLVPLGDSPSELAIRTHEMGHVKFSPPSPQPEKHGVEINFLQAVEDCRVNERLIRAGLADALSGYDDEGMAVVQGFPSQAVAIKCMHPTEAALFMIATHGFPGYVRVRDCLVAAGYKMESSIADAIVDKFRNGPATFEQTIEVSKYLAKILDKIPPDRRRRIYLVGHYGEPVETAGTKWGKLKEVQYPHLPLRVKHVVSILQRSSKKRPRDEGTYFRSPHRILVDNKVFARKVFKPCLGGTVLVDISGSMGLNDKQIDEIVRTAPASTIAVYSSFSGHASGYVRIVAKNGYKVSWPNIYPLNHGGGNVIDGPALEWLGKMPKPRVWLSDGVVTGVGDKICGALGRNANDLQSRYSIERLDEASKVIQHLQRHVVS